MYSKVASNTVFVVWLDTATHCRRDFVRAATGRTEHAEEHPCLPVHRTVWLANHVQEGGLAINGTPNGIIASSESSRHAKKPTSCCAAGSGWTRMFLVCTRENAVRFIESETVSERQQYLYLHANKEQ